MKSPSTQKGVIPELRWLDTVSELLDSRFRIPYTNMRFGLDAIIGLIPFAGDLISFFFSGVLVLAMVRHGASGKVVAKMLWNVAVDTSLGSVPIIGDLFDVIFKSNRRNFKLLRAHYEEGRHQGSIWPVLIAVLVVLIAIFLLLLYFIGWMLSRIWGML